MIPAAQQPVAALLRQVTGAEPIETHISAVYVGATEVLKLRKAVALGFLDFTEAADRERFTRREFALNAPHAPGLYRGVVAVTQQADGSLALGGAGRPVEHVLRMAPVPAGDFLDAVAAQGGLSPALLDAIGDAVAALHAALPPVPGWDSAAAMARVLEGNSASALEAGLPPARVAGWAEAARAALARAVPLLQSRAAEGRVRRCHGDLHLGNLCLWQGRVTPFDALEFDEALATIDTGYDLAFLLMDLEHAAGRAAANRVLNRYVAVTGDAALVGGLPLWLSLRAMVRAHVQQRRGQDAAAYLAQAEAALRPPPPRCIAVGGLQGSGKSRLARAIAPLFGAAPGALVLRSDEIRKRRHGAAPEQRLGAGAYTEAAGVAVFQDLFAAAHAALAAGHSVVADAAFLSPFDRAGIAAAAAAAGADFTGFWLTAPLELLKARIEARRGDASDATVAVLEQAAARDCGVVDWLPLDAGADPLPAACKALGIPPLAMC